MSPKSLMILSVESQYTQEYIANVFWSQHIAKVSSITLIPFIKNSEIYSIAYINIDEWCDSEAAYNFIQRLNDSSKEARIVYNEDDWWPVQFNTHNNGDIYVGSYTLAFDRTYFTKSVETETVSDDETVPCTEVDSDEYICDEEEWEEFVTHRPIKVGNVYRTVDEALERLYVLNEQLEERGLSWPEHRKLCEEMDALENELRIHETVNKSGNVTQRAAQFGLDRWFKNSLLNQEPPKREVAGEWYQEMIQNSRREIACSVDEYNANPSRFTHSTW